MKTIVLYGRGNTGKSTAIRRFFDKYVKDNSSYTIIKENIEAVDIRIKAVCNGKTVGIISHGDNEYCVQDGLDYVGDCDILICASRSKGAPKDLIKRKSNEIIWIEKETLYADDIIPSGEIQWLQAEQAENAATRINEILQLLLK